jgi:hypothetical protein
VNVFLGRNGLVRLHGLELISVQRSGVARGAGGAVAPGADLGGRQKGKKYYFVGVFMPF